MISSDIEITDISFKRNAVTLISNVDIIFSIDICNYTKREDVVKMITFSPSVNFEININNNVLNIFPKSILEELKTYELHIGDDNFLPHRIVNFTTGPYLYYTDEFFIKPEHWRIHYRINDNGIPEVYYNSSKKWEINPCTIAQYALACYDDYIWNDNAESKEVFMTQVKYLTENYHLVDNKIAYPYFFPTRNLQCPWYSGIAQGQVISALVRAYILSDNKFYLDIAAKIVAFMLLPVEQGGVFAYTPEGYEWIEEYPTNPSSFVWNGFVFAIMGLIDFNKVCPSHEITKHIENFLTAIKQTINIYDTGTMLYYERNSKHICNILYTGLQTYQARHLYFSTNDGFFLELYNKWKTYFKHDEAFLSIWYTKPKEDGSVNRKWSKYVPIKIKRILRKIIKP